MLESEVPAVVQVLGGGEVDVQISTAKRYPRSIVAFKKLALEMACLDEETAEACFYALPRDGKTVEGPSARFAEICASAWGNLRVEAKQVGEDDRFVTSRGTAWDLQANVAIAYEVKRRITTSAKKEGGSKKYSDDMVGVTSNAASSIALRNAVLKVIPAAYWKPIYVACRHAAVGDIQTLAKRRDQMLAHFQKMGVSKEQVFAVLNVKGADDITLDNLVTLKGLATAIKENETTIEEAFPSAAVKTPERKTEQKPSEPAKSEPKEQQQQPPQNAEQPKNIGVIVKVEPTGGGAFIHLDTKFVCSTRNDGHIKQARELRDDGSRVILSTKQHADSRYVPELTSIAIVEDKA